MTTTEFLSSLREKLGFLSEDDREKIVAFYADSLSACASAEEAERKINEIGTPDDIAAKVKAVAEGRNTVSAEPTTVKKDSEAPTVTMEAEIATDAPTVSANSPMADEVPAVSGAPTVVSSPASEPTVVSSASKEEVMDDAILAPFKRTPLPRAQAPAEWEHLYDDNALEETKVKPDGEVGSEDEEGERVSFKRRKKSKETEETEEVVEESIPEKPQKELKPITGPNLLDSLMKKKGKTPEESAGLFNMLRILFILPLLLISFLLVCMYLMMVAVVAGAVVALILLTLICGLCGVAGLAYGIVSFFTQSGVIAVIEIGLATILFAVVTALIALCYELIAGIIPALIKKLTALYLWLIRWFCYKLTGRNGLRELFKSQND